MGLLINCCSWVPVPGFLIPVNSQANFIVQGVEIEVINSWAAAGCQALTGRQFPVAGFRLYSQVSFIFQGVEIKVVGRIDC
jgi:hypothetical protein